MSKDKGFKHSLNDAPSVDEVMTGAKGAKNKPLLFQAAGRSLMIDFNDKHQVSDNFIKTLFSYDDAKFLKILLRQILPPDKLELLDIDNLRFENTELQTALQKKLHADFVVSVPVLGTSYQAVVVLLIEHKSYLDKQVLFQVHEYMPPLIKMGFLPVCSIVAFHNVEGCKFPKDLHQSLELQHPVLNDARFKKAFSKSVVNFECEFVDLTKLTENLSPVLKENEVLTMGFISHTLSHAKTQGQKDQARAIHELLVMGESLQSSDYDFLVHLALGYLSASGYKEVIREVHSMGRTSQRAQKALDFWDAYALHEQGMGYKEGHKEGHKEGVERGVFETQNKVVLGLLAVMTPEKIAQHCRIPLKQVLEIQNKNVKKS